MANPDRLFSFPTSCERVVDTSSPELIRRVVSDSAAALYNSYERDFLYLPNHPEADLATFLAHRYPDRGEERSELCAEVFAEFDRLLETASWKVDAAEAIEFFRYRAEEEINLLQTQELGGTYRHIAQMSEAPAVCRYLMSQFALDYLTEASPLTRVLPGAFGDLQMAIFRIVDDEYGSGRLEHKHSVLFQKTLRSLGMSDELDTYRPHILPCVYMYLCYVNRVCADKRLFARFLGFLFVYEACLIYSTQQQGLLLRQVLGERVDTTYFDLHVSIDTDHGQWCVDKMLVPVIRKYGADAAREILRGYHETLVLLAICEAQISAEVRANALPDYCFN